MNHRFYSVFQCAVYWLLIIQKSHLLDSNLFVYFPKIDTSFPLPQRQSHLFQSHCHSKACMLFFWIRINAGKLSFGRPKYCYVDQSFIDYWLPFPKLRCHQLLPELIYMHLFFNLSKAKTWAVRKDHMFLPIKIKTEALVWYSSFWTDFNIGPSPVDQLLPLNDLHFFRI